MEFDHLNHVSFSLNILTSKTITYHLITTEDDLYISMISYPKLTNLSITGKVHPFLFNWPVNHHLNTRPVHYNLTILISRWRLINWTLAGQSLLSNNLHPVSVHRLIMVSMNSGGSKQHRIIDMFPSSRSLFLDSSSLLLWAFNHSHNNPMTH